MHTAAVGKYHVSLNSVYFYSGNLEEGHRYFVNQVLTYVKVKVVFINMQLICFAFIAKTLA